jgi:deoxyribodipyrimidine photo-lyase
MAPQLVWFKRDLRLADHEPLLRASSAGPVLGLYVFEPSLLHAPTTDPSHVAFILASLQELGDGLRRRGGHLLLRKGELPEVFDRIHHRLPFEALWSHEETGDGMTYARDLRVAAWCRERGVRWTELPQTGVLRGRGRHSRANWSREWTERMSKPARAAPEPLATVDIGSLSDVATIPGNPTQPTLADLGLPATGKSEAVPGGESLGRDTLRSFLSARGAHYRTDLSSPVTSWEGCSRLSPYIAYGNLSLKQVFQASQLRLRDLRLRRRHTDPAWFASLESFESRLRWHCHFIQKLEDEPELEFRNLNPAFDGLREEDRERWTVDDARRFDAWCQGRTGFPMVDAVMRALHRGGWINFRMRAMVVSFVCHQLWLHWQPAAQFLARHFLDYEPGIHYPQFQMQAGTTGMNTTRIYSPAKQVREQDPRGEFIKRYVPELAAVPPEWLPEPHRMPMDLQRRIGCIVGRDYPAPVVDARKAYAHARAKLEATKRRAQSDGTTEAVVRRHGSRRPRPFGPRTPMTKGSRTRGR